MSVLPAHYLGATLLPVIVDGVSCTSIAILLTHMYSIVSRGTSILTVVNRGGRVRLYNGKGNTAFSFKFQLF